MNKFPGEDLIEKLLYDKRVCIDAKREVNGIPLFFYRYPLFASQDINIETSSSKSTELSVTPLLSYNHLRLLEVISTANKKEDGLFFSELSKSVLDNMFHGGTNLLIEQLVSMRLSIRSGNMRQKQFMCFSGYSFDPDTNKYRFYYSVEYATLFNFDYLFPIEKHFKLFGLLEEKTARILRAVLSVPYGVKYGIHIENAAKKLGLSLSGIDLTRIKKDFRKHTHMLRSLGILYDESSQIFHYDKQMYPQYTQPSGEVEEDPEYILTERMLKKAEELGVDARNAEEVFDDFLVFLKKKKYKSVNRAWSLFLKKTVQTNPEVAKKLLATEIELGDDFRNLCQKHNTENEAVEIFSKFVNHHIVKGTSATKQQWLALWENYIIVGVEMKNKRAMGSPAIKQEIETEFYLARLVSDDIVHRLGKKNVSVSDIIRGRVEVEEIEYRSWTVPPSIGKGKETLFRWKDPKKQMEAILEYVTLPSLQAQNFIEVSVNE